MHAEDRRIEPYDAFSHKTFSSLAGNYSALSLVGAEMVHSEDSELAKPHYIVRRSRSGRFNFVMITDAGRFTGYVTTELDGRSNTELDREAREKIRALAVSFAEATGLMLNTGAE